MLRAPCALCALTAFALAVSAAGDDARAQTGNSAGSAGNASSAASAPAGNAFDVDSSLINFVNALARQLEARAKLERVSGAVRIDVTPSRGLDAGKVERAFTPRLKKRLKDGGVLVPVADASWNVRTRITLSEDGGLVWATALLDGPTMIGPASVASSWPVDRELESALGAVVKPAQTRFVLERLGAVPAGVLDAALVDVDGDGVDELALLGVDGLRLFRAGPQRLERIGSLVKMPTDKKWPRVAAGWLARVEPSRLWAVTSAGHSLLVDTRTMRADAGPTDLVPFRGAPGPQGPLCGQWRYASPVVALPLVALTGGVVRTPSLPSRVRDIAYLDDDGRIAPGISSERKDRVGDVDAWILIDDQGALLSQKPGEPPTSLAGERVGDRLALADLDGDGEAEVVTTSASLPGEPDHIVLRRIAKDLSSSTVVFRSPLSGGSIAATAVGKLDVPMSGAGRVDVVLIEEVGREALAWRLRYAP